MKSDVKESMQQPGLFITLEGADGCGKSTQARLLVDYLKKNGYPVLLTREPGGTPLAEEIRRVILTPGDENLDSTAEILLYAASRAQHVNGFIKPALVTGKMVICERFIDSSFAYQGYGLGMDLDIIKAVNRMAIGDFEPDLTFLLDIDTKAAQRRIRERSAASQSGIDRIESRSWEFHEKVRQGFRELAKHSSRIVLIDASRQGIKEIHHSIVAILRTRLTMDSGSRLSKTGSPESNF
jgi:dTMP kinase